MASKSAESANIENRKIAGRKPTSVTWVERARSTYVRLSDADLNHSARAVFNELQRQYKDDLKGCPKERTIGRLISPKLFPEVEHMDYAFFRWPATMEQGALPWEAAGELLSLERERPFRKPIPIRFARWYWRACLAMPKAGSGARSEVAGYLAACEVLGRRPRPDMEILHAYLQYAPWRGKDSEEEYEAAIAAGATERFIGQIRLSAEDDIVFREFIASSLGVDLPGVAWAVEDIIKHGPPSQRAAPGGQHG